MTSSSIASVSLACEGVLLAHVVGADEPHLPSRVGRQHCLGAVAEPRLGPRHVPAAAAGRPERGVPGDRPEGEHRAQARPGCSRSRSSHAAHVAFSSVVGLLAGGAHRTAATIRSPVSTSPSPEATDVGWLAYPPRWRAAYSQSPERSPVNIRPVRLVPLAAGARPTTSTSASGSPNDGPGRPQYGWSANAARRPSVATDSRHPTRRGQARHTLTRASSLAYAVCSLREPAHLRRRGRDRRLGRRRVTRPAGARGHGRQEEPAGDGVLGRVRQVDGTHGPTLGRDASGCLGMRRDGTRA